MMTSFAAYVQTNPASSKMWWLAQQKPPTTSTESNSSTETTRQSKIYDSTWLWLRAQGPTIREVRSSSDHSDPLMSWLEVVGRLWSKRATTSTASRRKFSPSIATSIA